MSEKSGPTLYRILASIEFGPSIDAVRKRGDLSLEASLGLQLLSSRGKSVFQVSLTTSCCISGL